MSKLFRQALLLVTAAVLGTLGTVFVASAASAITLAVTINGSPTLRFCNTTSCPPPDNTTVPPGSAGKSFCTLGASDLVYTGSVNRRGGFVPRANLSNQTQFTPCNSNPQFGIVVVTQTQMRYCTVGDCLPVGQIVPANASGAAFCVRPNFVLVYIAPLAGSTAGNRGAFVPRSAITGNIPTASC